MELNYRTEMFMTAMNDLYFVNSRLIATDWANALELASKQGAIDVPDYIIEEIRQHTPGKLNDILRKGGGRIYKNPDKKNQLIIELNVEKMYKDQNLITPYLSLLNDNINDCKYNFNTNYGLKFAVKTKRPLKLTKIAEK